MKIGVVTDIHYRTPEGIPGERLAHASLERLEKALREFEAAGAELLVCLGDLLNTQDRGELDRQTLRKVAGMLKASSLPCLCVMGNHDCEAFTREEFVALSGLAIAPASITVGNETLHFLDANYRPTGEAHVPPIVHWEEALVPPDQLSALREDLRDASRRHFIFCHQCLDPQVESRHIIANAAEVRAVLEGANVPAVIQGHFHWGARHTVNGIAYITLAALCDEDSAWLLDTNDF